MTPLRHTPIVSDERIKGNEKQSSSAVGSKVNEELFAPTTHSAGVGWEARENKVAKRMMRMVRAPAAYATQTQTTKTRTWHILLHTLRLN